MSKVKKHRCKDSLGSADDNSLMFFDLAPHELKQFVEECKDLGIREGDEIMYRMNVAAKDRLPHDIRKKLIATEKTFYQTELLCKKALNSETTSAESKAIALVLLKTAALYHPLWLLAGARRAKTAEDMELIKTQRIEDMMNLAHEDMRI